MDDDGYEGPAVLAVEGRAEFTVRARLTGSFQPLDGRYRWYGRLEAHEELTRMVGDRSAGVVLRTSEGTRRAASPNPTCGTATGSKAWACPRSEFRSPSKKFRNSAPPATEITSVTA